MSKKDQKKENKCKDFIEMLKDNKDKIFVMSGEEKISLSDAVEKTIENITCVVKDGIIPISSEEATKKKTSEGLNLEARYAKAPFVLYEYAMKYRKIPQTMVLTLTPNDVEDLFTYNVNSTITTLMERTNIALILKKMTKAKTKIKNWLESDSEKDLDIFVINIPDIVLFTNTIKKKEVSNSVMFNLCIQVVKTKKKLSKLRKKDPDKYEEVLTSVFDETLNIAISLGNSYLHMELNDTFMPDVRKYFEHVVEAIKEPTTEKLINRIIYSTIDTNQLVEASNVLFETVIK